MLKKTNFKKLPILILISALSACSNSGGNSSSYSNNSGDDVNALQIITPRVVYSKSGTIGDGYVVINNPTNTTMEALHYSLDNQIGGGKGVSVDPASAANCTTIAAYSQCNLKLLVESGAVAGSFAVNASNDNSLLSKLSNVATSTTRVVGVEQAAYNNLSGADGITLSYYHTVINGTAYILVSGLIASANAGTFNNIVLVDNNGNAIPGQSLITGSSSYAKGATFNIILPVPSGTNASQTIKVQTQQISNGQTKVVSTATTSSTLATKANIGIVEMLPSAVYLTSTNPEQIITFVNIGDESGQLEKLVTNNSAVEVISSPTNLSPGETTTAILKVKDLTRSAATTGNVILTYNNSESETVTSAEVDVNVNHGSTPTPTPTPAPTPTPTPTRVAGLTAVFSPDDNFFTTTAVGTVSRELTLTNSGNTDENGMTLTLPANFTIGAGSSNSCTVTQSSSPATISNTLTSGTGSCNITVSYTNNVATPQSAGDISIAYNYNSGTAAPSPTVAGVNYKVTQSTANLTLSPSTQNYGSISSDNIALSPVQTLTLTNSGEVPATNLVFNFGGTNPSFFTSTGSSTCLFGGTLSNVVGSNSCTIDTQFGPAPNGSAGAKSATFNVSYTPYTGGTTATTTNVDLSGTVTAAPSANFAVSYTNTGSPFLSGAGTSDSPYQGYTGSSYTIEAVYSNNSAVTATGFTTSYTPPTGWILSNHGCNNVNMSASGGTCTDVYTLNSGTTGAYSLLLQHVIANWSDNSGTYTNQATTGSEVHVNLTTAAPPPASITITSVTDWQTMMGSAYAFTATITGGSSTVTPTVTGITSNTVSPTSCALDSSDTSTSSCIFIVTPYTGAGNYSFWDPTNIANSTDVNAPATAYSQTIDLSVAATNSATINGNPSPQTFSNIAGTVIAPYVYLPQTGQTPTAPIDVTAIAGADGNVQAGIPWAVAPGGGSTAPNPRFTDNGCDITDNLTGLTWVKDLNTVNGGAPLTWDAALTTAASSTWCGQAAGTWRVPNVNELASLNNYGVANQAFNWLNVAISSGGAGFSNVQVNNYWTSSSDATNAWVVEMSYGGIGRYVKSNSSSNYLFPVRGG